jgi:hypothetical protein
MAGPAACPAQSLVTLFGHHHRWVASLFLGHASLFWQRRFISTRLVKARPTMSMVALIGQPVIIFRAKCTARLTQPFGTSS